MMTIVALPFQLYQITHSTAMVGMLGLVQLVPSVIGGLFGGSLADVFDRKKLIVIAEGGMAALVLLLGLAELFDFASAPLLFIVSGSIAILNGLHRPAMESLTPRLVQSEDMTAVATLNSLRGNIATIGGPAVGGIVIASLGLHTAYFIDFISFAASVIAILNLPFLSRSEKAPTKFSFALVREGYLYAFSRKDLIGTYLIDILAMTFSMPNLLFPAVAERFGGVAYLGWLHSGISVGALLATLTSGYFHRYSRHGLMIALAAAAWSVAMIGFGLSPIFPMAFCFLVIAGYADMVSAVFRQTIWNQTIPDHLRGRLAGIEMISYLAGPLLGNTQLGFLAASMGVQRAVAVSSGVGLVLIGIASNLLPEFIKYRAPGARTPKQE